MLNLGLIMNERFFIPKQIARLLLPQMLYIVLVPAFFVGFCIYYNPFDIKGFFSIDDFGHSFHIVMLACIIFANLLIFRLLFLTVQKYWNMNLYEYLFWCLIEIFAAACFLALYTDLIFGKSMNYLQSLGFSIQISYLVLIYPYAFLILWQLFRRQKESTEEKALADENALVKFYDERKKLKLTISSSSILFVTAEFNYVRINYIDSGRVKVFMLRNSMKSLAENAASYGIVRCQRSYFVNPRRIRILRRDKEGYITAELDVDGIQPVPVSKQYYDSLASLL